MDWARIIERNSAALVQVVAAIFALLSVAEGAQRISRPLHRAVLRMLGPAESATRRLIVIAAQGLVARPAPARAMPSLPIGRSSRRRPPFRLFDRRKRLSPDSGAAGAKTPPRIHVFGGDPRVAARWPSPAPPPPIPAPPDDGLVDARAVTWRLEALRHALGDVPRQARRLARLRARRAADPALRHRSPLRPGPPPGHRKIPVHDIDAVLADCHAFAREVLAADTS